MDTLSSEKRSSLMARVRQKNTQPEIQVRKILHALGYRFRLHRRDLPGKPDIVFPKYKSALFVHGCFWHGHDCRRGRGSKSNVDFWREKIATNKSRDKKCIDELHELGWKTITIWQCELKNLAALEALLKKKLT